MNNNPKVIETQPLRQPKSNQTELAKSKSYTKIEGRLVSFRVCEKQSSRCKRGFYFKTYLAAFVLPSFLRIPFLAR